MKCPLMFMSWQSKPKERSFQPVECLKGKCAWWDNGQPGCAILTIAQELATIRQKEEVEL